jgi:pyruvate formate lyase activating enzyme
MEAYDIATEKLNYVYIGNIVSDVGQDSICPNCGETLVKRSGYSTKVVGLSNNRCVKCDTELNFVN